MQSNFVKMLHNPLGASAPFGANMCMAGFEPSVGLGIVGTMADLAMKGAELDTAASSNKKTNETNLKINEQQLV